MFRNGVSVLLCEVPCPVGSGCLYVEYYEVLGDVVSG
jgi:hypothetical protein